MALNGCISFFRKLRVIAVLKLLAIPHTLSVFALLASTSHFPLGMFLKMAGAPLTDAGAPLTDAQKASKRRLEQAAATGADVASILEGVADKRAGVSLAQGTGTTYDSHLIESYLTR